VQADTEVTVGLVVVGEALLAKGGRVFGGSEALGKRGQYSRVLLTGLVVGIAAGYVGAAVPVDPLTAKNGMPASPATARASSVLPVPGGPTMRTPLGPTAPARA
jgi:hypothetical protein